MRVQVPPSAPPDRRGPPPDAQALSIAPAVERAGAQTADASDLRGRAGWFPAAVAAAISLGGLLLALGVIWDDDGPDSP